MVIALGMEMFTREFRKKRACASKLVLAIIGITAGMLCGIFGVGALLAAYVSRVTETDSSFKANISAVFIVDNTFRIILYKALGLLTLGTDGLPTNWQRSVDSTECPHRRLAARSVIIRSASSYRATG